MSEVEMSIPIDSLRKLPTGAVYQKKSGQAGAKVSTNGNTVIVIATCDSLQREVDYFESLYLSTKSQLDNLKEAVLTEKEQRSNPVKIALVALLIGIGIGIFLTTLINKNYRTN